VTHRAAKPPSDVESERIILGTWLLDQRRLDIALEIIPAGLMAAAAESVNGANSPNRNGQEPLFFSRKHQIIFGVLCLMAELGEKISLPTLAARLHSLGLLDAVGGQPYLAGLEDDIFSLDALPQLLTEVVEHWRRRSFIRKQSELISDAGDTARPLGEVLEQSAITNRDIAAAGEGVKTYDLWDLDRLFALELSDDDAIVGDFVIAKGELTTMIGPPGTFKSRAVIGLSVSIIANRELWFDRLPVRAHDLKILIVQTENSARRVRVDLAAELKGCTAAEREQVNARLRVYIPKGVEDGDLGLDQDEAKQRLTKTIASFDPALVIFDPLGDFFVGDNENDSMQMRRTVKAIMQVAQSHSPQTAVLVLHHARSGKAAAAGADSWERGSFGRGSKALLSMTRAQLNMIPGSGDGNTVVVASGKNSNGRAFEPFAIRFDPETLKLEADRDFDFEEWQEELGGKKGGKPGPLKPDLVKLVLRDLGGSVKKSNLVREVQNAASCGRSTVYELVGRMLDNGELLEGGGMIAIPQ